MTTAYVPKDGRPLRLLVIQPPPDYLRLPEARELIRKLGQDLRAILTGKQMVLVPDGWKAEVVEVDGVTIGDDS